MTLSHQQGRQIVRTVTHIMDTLDRSWLDLRGQCSERDFAEYGEKVSTALESLTGDVLLPLFQDHPELEPLADEELAKLRQDQ